MANSAILQRPVIKLLFKQDKRIKDGHPWVYSNEIKLTPELKAAPRGTIVDITASDGKPLGTGMFNPHTLIAARLLTRERDAAIDRNFLTDKLKAALTLRSQFFAKPFYRLIHAEADGLPGVIIDRYGDVVVIELNTAGMDALRAELVAAIDALLQPKVIYESSDSAARKLEGLEPVTQFHKGEIKDAVKIEENDVSFFIDPCGGQKTGWFFDQRMNRKMVANLARGKTVLDAYCYLGGFGLTAAKEGASKIAFVDSSASALGFAKKSAAANGVDDKCEFFESEVFVQFEKWAISGRTFEIVVSDPPAFAKSKKDHGVALNGYRKLAEMSAKLVRPGGFLFIASCSHPVTREEFNQQVERGLQRAGRTGRILSFAGAGPDHPVHAFIPQTAYLKGLLLQID
jgi:23S rRNA (cytosine1962-C5)-methyltransferase